MSQNFFISFVIEGGSGEVNDWEVTLNCEVAAGIQYTLRELRHALAFVSVLVNADAELGWQFGNNHGSIPLPAGPDERKTQSDLLNKFVNRLLIAQVASHPSREIKLNIEQISFAINENAEIISAIFDQNPVFRVSNSVFNNIKKELLEIKGCIILPFAINITDLCYSAIAKFDILKTNIRQEGDDDVLSLSCEMPQLSNESLAKKSEAQARSLMRQAEILRDNEPSVDRLIVLLDWSPNPPFLDSPAPSA